MKINKDDMRPVKVSDFEKAVQSTPPSVSQSTLAEFDAWRKDKGVSV